MDPTFRSGLDSQDPFVEVDERYSRLLISDSYALSECDVHWAGGGYWVGTTGLYLDSEFEIFVDWCHCGARWKSREKVTLRGHGRCVG